MHKLLIASQKGGVGKTTTAINLAMLAAHSGKRVLLVDADPLGSVSAALKLSRRDGKGGACPVAGLGWLWPNLLPNLDVMTAYAAGSQNENDLKSFFNRLPDSDYEERYDEVIIDSPPALLGERTKSLLRTCDDLLIVIRAEPMAYRTLPGYLDELQQAQAEGNGCRLKGILLTSPQGMEEDSEWEHQLRTRFGKAVFPQIIPHSPEANKAVLVGKPITVLAPESDVAISYQSVADTLGLTGAGLMKTQEFSPDLIAPLPRFQQQQDVRRPASAPDTRRPASTPSYHAIPSNAMLAVAEPIADNGRQSHGSALAYPSQTVPAQPEWIWMAIAGLAFGLMFGVGALFLMK